ncbi:MAG: aromatic acid exporter family protein [Eubacteriaceae bacterium]|jgi:uncharacterized membrane protein YgaE (UPF0421/DUF939 family)|nr:aromatic acid exporter family protein [Eubacteriaceae bacterium]
MRTNLNAPNMQMALRIAVGIIAAVIIAQNLGLEFAASTCIVTLLGIQSTKKETWIIAGKRVVSLAYTMCIVIVMYELLGINLRAFCAAIVLLTFITYAIGWNPTLSINVVVLVHIFIQQVPFSGELVFNEIIRVTVGMLIALAINWKLPTMEKQMRQDIVYIENDIRDILHTFAEILRANEKVSPETAARLTELRQHLISGKENAYKFENNNLLPHAKYYANYISMRQTEGLIIYNIYKHIQKIEKFDESTDKLADYIDAIGHGIAMEHEMDEIKEQSAAAGEALDNIHLPATNDELYEIALKFFIMGSLEEMIEAKERFIETLTHEEITRYWTDEHR